MTSFYTEEELKGLGFRHIGNGVCISRKASIYGAQNISLGDHVRIDDFCILSGRIEIGSYVRTLRPTRPFTAAATAFSSRISQTFPPASASTASVMTIPARP